MKFEGLAEIKYIANAKDAGDFLEFSGAILRFPE